MVRFSLKHPYYLMSGALLAAWCCKAHHPGRWGMGSSVLLHSTNLRIFSPHHNNHLCFKTEFFVLMPVQVLRGSTAGFPHTPTLYDFPSLHQVCQDYKIHALCLHGSPGLTRIHQKTLVLPQQAESAKHSPSMLRGLNQTCLVSIIHGLPTMF